jgi:hypothetical protein
LPAAFLSAVFYGDVWIGVTIPVAILLLPLILLLFPPTDVLHRGVLPAGAVLLLGMVVPVLLQIAGGYSLAGKSDAVVFLPIAYGILTIVGFRRVTLPDHVMWRALLTGGLLTGAVMIVAAVVLPAGTYLVPGQDYVRTDQEFQQGRPTQSPATTAPATTAPATTAPATTAPATTAPATTAPATTAPATTDQSPPPSAQPTAAASISPSATAAPTPTFEFDPAIDQSTTAFYGLKDFVKNALGRSNYIAVFFVFLFTVALFRRSWFAVVFALLAAVTLSRFAIVFMGCSIILWWLDRRKVTAKAIVTGALFLSLVGFASILVVAQFLNLPSSLSARVAYWQSGLYVGSHSPLFGMPRSEIVNTFNFSIVWNPHDVFLWAFAITGLMGVVLYASYVYVVLKSMYRAAVESRLWLGILIGSVVVLAWSLVEIIAMTPAFEILFACLYCLARDRTRDSGLTVPPNSSPVAGAQKAATV